MPIPSRPFWVTSGENRSKSKGNTFKQDDEPANPNDGDCWFSPDDGQVYYYYDGEFINKIPPPSYGYTIAQVSFERINFAASDGGATMKGNLSYSRSSSGGCNSSEYGFCMGGQAAAESTYIDRFAFPFDSGNASHVGNISASRRIGGACNCSTHGYTMGGEYPNNTNISTIDRIIFPFNSGTASHVGNTSTATRQNGEFNSSQHGFVFGGYTSPQLMVLPLEELRVQHILQQLIE